MPSKYEPVREGTFYSEKHGRIVVHHGYSTRIHWSKDMLDYLKQHYATTLNDELAGCLGVSLRTLIRKIRMVFENPIMGQTFLRVFLKQPDVKDNNRMARGDYMIKPTGYWFWNCTPTHGRSFQRDKKRIEPMKLPKAPKAGQSMR